MLRNSSYMLASFDFISDISACGAGAWGGVVSGVGGEVPCARAKLLPSRIAAKIAVRIFPPVSERTSRDRDQIAAGGAREPSGSKIVVGGGEAFAERGASAV